MDKRKKKLMEEMMMICEELEWNILIQQREDTDDVHGLIMGTPDFIDEIIQQDLMEEIDSEDALLDSMLVGDPKKKKDSVH